MRDFSIEQCFENANCLLKKSLKYLFANIGLVWVKRKSNIGAPCLNIDQFDFKISGSSSGVNYIEQFSRLSKF